MTFKEAFRAAIELDRDDIVKLIDSLSAVVEVSAAVPAPEPEPASAKPKVRRAKKQKATEKVMTAVIDRDGNAPWS